MDLDSTDHQAALDPAADSDGDGDAMQDQPLADSSLESNRSSDGASTSDSDAAVTEFLQALEFGEDDNERLAFDDLYEKFQLDKAEEIWKFRESLIFTVRLPDLIGPHLRQQHSH